VTQIDIGYYDADPDNRLFFRLHAQYILGGGAYQNVGTIATNTSDGAGTISITSLNYTVSDNKMLALLVTSETAGGTPIAWPDNNLKVTGVRVHYQISEAF